MIKQLILLIQLIGLFFYQLLFTGDLAVTQKVPSTLIQGEESIIEITINKEDVSGFAKVQQILPEGFTAEPLDTKGATFSFKDNKVKFIWMALPAEKEFTITYKLKPNQTTSGEFMVAGKFSFISESERKNIDIPASNFSVVSEGMTAEVVEEEQPVVTINEEEPEELIEEVIPEVALVAEVPETVPEEIPEEEVNTIKILTVKGKRTIENVEGRKFKVTVEIEKEGVEGFAKITEEIPPGFMASEGESVGGVFSFKKNDVKILWLAVPKEDIYSISYNIVANETTENGNFSIKGHYAYLENDMTRKYDIDGSGFDLNATELIAEESVEEVIPEIVAEEEQVLVEEVVEESVSEELEEPVAAIETPIAETVKEEVLELDNTKEVTSTPDPEHSVTYKVQVGAGHKKVPETYFKTKFSLMDNVSTMNHEGWIKYLVGSFNEYKGARDKRNNVRKNVKRAFVTAYNAGNRITVQEALMITRQKWYN